jgi:3-oxoacyl-[acyl-carrier protein] reductase
VITPLAGQVAIVTGGSGGIGRACSVALARAGAAVVVTGRDTARVEETVALARAARAPETGATAEAAAVIGVAPLDVRDTGALETMAARVLETFGRIDVLVAAAGVGRGKSGFAAHPVHKMNPGDWDEILATNLTGVFLSARAVLPAMIARGAGQIVAIGSAIAGTAGQPYAAAYSASKFALRALCESLEEEAGPLGVRVELLLPGLVDTPLVRGGTLLARGALSPEAVADVLVEMLSLPDDAVIAAPIVEAFAAGGGR